MWVGQLPTLRQLLLAVMFAGIALMFGLRRRAVAHVQANLHVNAAAAAALLNTPTWRVSTWRRPPASSLPQWSIAHTASRRRGARSGADHTGRSIPLITGWDTAAHRQLQQQARRFNGCIQVGGIEAVRLRNSFTIRRVLILGL